jgi:hypothetical protein
MWFLREQKHTVFGPGNPETAGQGSFQAKERPSQVCFCSLRNHTSVVTGIYLSNATKTTEKQLLILEFYMPSLT